jgi:2-amino-4-hydroxy-6-hydroxymethyldihydropteridine diphosphokinase
VTVRIAVALGSNLGDRHAHLDFAVGRLRSAVDALVVSRAIETDPVGDSSQPRYLNAAAVGATTLSARALLEFLLRVEAERGRQRPHPGAARTLDLDLVFYGDAIIAEPGLEVPHPRFRDRAFVLEPLAEVAPDLRDPVTGLTVEALLARL